MKVLFVLILAALLVPSIAKADEPMTDLEHQFFMTLDRQDKIVFNRLRRAEIANKIYKPDTLVPDWFKAQFNPIAQQPPNANPIVVLQPVPQVQNLPRPPIPNVSRQYKPNAPPVGQGGNIGTFAHGSNTPPKQPSSTVWRLPFDPKTGTNLIPRNGPWYIRNENGPPRYYSHNILDFREKLGVKDDRLFVVRIPE